jgi:hypothetical protein
MNDHDFGDDLRAALRPDDGIRPLDPATVIAGAHRRRRVRGLAAAGLASVAVLAIAAGGLLASGSPTGTAPAPAGPPTAGTPGVLPDTPRPPSNPPSPTPPFNLPDATPTGPLTAGMTVAPPGAPQTMPDTPGTPDAAGIAAFAARCGTAVKAENPGPGGAATQRATLAGPEGITTIFADGIYWGACDNGYDPTEVTLRKPASIQRPSRDNLKHLAVANNLITRDGQQYEYYWAAGVLPQGVAGVRYRFTDGAVVDATVTGDFWLMQHRSSTPGAHQPDEPPIEAELLAPNGTVLVTHELEWGLHTCAQITHGC